MDFDMIVAILKIEREYVTFGPKIVQGNFIVIILNFRHLYILVKYGSPGLSNSCGLNYYMKRKYAVGALLYYLNSTGGNEISHFLGSKIDIIPKGPIVFLT
jgi:hypothetical protein